MGLPAVCEAVAATTAAGELVVVSATAGAVTVTVATVLVTHTIEVSC